MMPPPTTRTATSRMAARTRGMWCDSLSVGGIPVDPVCLASWRVELWSRYGGGVAGPWRSGGTGSIDSGTLHCQDSAMPDDERYSLTELADLAGVTPRTVRYYLAQGLLPAVGQTGPGSKYDERTPRAAAADPPAPGRAPAAGRDPPPARRPRPTTRSATSPEPASPRRRARRALEYLRAVLGGAPLRTSAQARRQRPAAAPHAGTRGRHRPPAARHSRHPRCARRRVPVRAIVGARVHAVDGDPSPDRPRDAACRPAELPPSVSEPRPIERSQWERIVLAPDVELHIRRPLARAQQKQVDRLVDDRP